MNVTRVPVLSLPSASLPASIVTSSSSSSSSVAGQMMYPGGHTVMYATSTPSLGDGSLTVLNTFPPAGHAQSHDPGKPPGLCYCECELGLGCREADASYYRPPLVVCTVGISPTYIFSFCCCPNKVLSVVLSGAIPQVFLASLPPVAGQIPVSAVQLHPVRQNCSLQY